MKKLLDIFIKYKTGAKVGGGVGVGAAILYVVTYLHGDISMEIAHAETRSKAFVTQEVKAQQVHIEHLKDGQRQIMDQLKVMNQRIYDHSVNHSKTQ